MPLITQTLILRGDLRANPDVLYIFGDNEARCGLGGQAGEMRDEANAVGVATLKAPGDYWNANDTGRQCSVIDADLKRARDHLAHGGIVVFPADGIGTGIADLRRRAPDTFAYLQIQVEAMRQPG
jgi:hypothetical protein